MARPLVALLLLAALAAPASAYRDAKLQEAVAKAAEQAARGNPTDGVRILQKVAASLKTGEAYVALARLQQRLGASEEAAAAFKSARELAGGDPEVLTAVAGFVLSTGPAKEALPLAESAVSRSSGCQALATLARVLVRANDLERTKATLEKAFGGPGCALAHEAQGDLLSATGQAAEAVAAYRKALELDPGLLEARVGLVFALVAAGQGGEALAEARRAEKDAPASPEVLAAKGLATMAGGQAASWGEAIAAAQRAAAANPQSPTIRLAVGRIFEAQPDPERALAAYKKALEIDPSFLPARLSSVRLEVTLGDTAAAGREAKVLAEEVPWSGEARFLHARELLRAKDVAGALPMLEKAIRMAPANAEAHALLGAAAFLAGDADRAVTEYKKAIELQPSNVAWRADYGYFLARGGETEAGLAELKKVVETPGYRDAAGWTNLGWTYRSCKPPRTEEAVTAYKTALEIDPKQEQAALGLGWAYMMASRFDESIKAYDQALQVEPKVAGEAHDGIAWDHYFKGDTAKARESLGRAKAAGRDDPLLVQSIARVEKRRDVDRRTRERERHDALKAFRCYGMIGDVRSKSAGVRAGALRALAGSDCPGVVEALQYALATDEVHEVKVAAANALGGLGPAAKAAVPYLKPFTRECDIHVNATPELIVQEERCQKLRGAAARALDKIQNR